MAPHQKDLVPCACGQSKMEVTRADTVSSVESAIPSTSKDVDTLHFTPLTTRSRARSDSVSSASSYASTVSIKSDASSRSTRSRSGSGSSSRSRSRSPIRPNAGKRKNKARETERRTIAGGSEGKVTKRRKAPRLTMTKQKRAYHPKKGAIEKVLREEATSKNFILSDLDWSQWKPVIRRKRPDSKKDAWERRHEDHVGYRQKQITTMPDNPAVYEFAVVTPEKQKVPVLGSVTMGMNGRSWEGAMLSKPKMRSQIDRVLRRGCKLYARRASFSARDMPSVYDKCPIDRKRGRSRVTTEEAVHELRGLMMKVHDYAWRDHYDIESRTYSHRPLVVDSVKMSD